MRREKERGYSIERRPGSLGREESQVVVNGGILGRDVRESLFSIFINNLNPRLDLLGLWKFFKLYGKINYEGVPLRYWKPEFFMKLNRLLGEPVLIEQETMQNERFDRCRFLVLLPLYQSCPSMIKSPLLILEEKGSPLVVNQDNDALGRRNGIGQWICVDKTLAKGLDHQPKLNLVNDKDLKEGKVFISNLFEGFGDKVVRENLDKVKLTNDKVSHVSLTKLALDVRKDKVGICLNQINSWREGCWLNFKNFKKGCYREGFASPNRGGKSNGRNEDRKKWKMRDSSVSQETSNED
ncbi:hypothetical protein Ddye_026653 [Dipteronia dyeriana]|uniref:DUF4283 domain-containing protein n=1 Tax=Dipteronia dyeriana TaxID=168575 RepID=A0AAD9TND8_9ROSI|nr:hypothetical protein Ddye_026653 [Dipteronia dyeriana]